MSIKLTKQRQRILELIQKSEGHMTADEIHSALKQENTSVGIATVYRNLNLLYEENYINRVRHPDLGYIYDKNTTDHYHFRCVKCNRIMDVDIPYQDSINALVEMKTKGKVLSHSIVFEGICDKCLEKEPHLK